MVDTIYVLLLDEGVDVWRPVRVHRVSEDVYLIPSATVVPEGEVWEFNPGETVRTRLRDLSSGEVKVAFEKIVG